MLGLKPSQYTGWDSNPRDQDLNPAKVHGTWFQDLMDLRFLMSHHRRYSVTDQVDLFKEIQREAHPTDTVWTIAEGQSSSLEMWRG